MSGRSKASGARASKRRPRKPDYKVGYGRPPKATRFKKGQSGNPSGRQSGDGKQWSAAIDIVIDKTLTVRRNGVPREVTMEEALQHRTLQDALAGKRMAQRQVLKWIARREEWFAKEAAKKPPKPIETRFERDPHNADEALRILGIATKRVRNGTYRPEHEELLLEHWAVQAALDRIRRPRLTDKDVERAKSATRDSESVRWPKGLPND